MYFQYQLNVTPAAVGQGAWARIDVSRRQIIAGEAGATPVPVTDSGVAPVGGGITWQAPVAVAMTGSSKVFVPATAGMKALQMWSPAANAVGGIDLAAGTVVLAAAIQLQPGAAPIYIEGAPCPIGGVTAIGTNTQNFYYQIGL